MIGTPDDGSTARRWPWGLAFGLLALYVAARMGAFSLSADVATPDGTVRLPTTYASVDHPFHVARAETLWRELASGNVPRWIGQHQGGYPVEFYPLGEAWLEVVVRALSLGTLAAESAHTLTIIALFLLPGVAFAAMAREDGWSPAVGLVALALHVSLPGGWYDGGYTELVQWGLVTNVAGAVASMLMLPALIRFLRSGAGWTGAAAAALAAFAIHCNPRSLLGLAALGLGAWLAGMLMRTPGERLASRRSTLTPLPPSSAPSPVEPGEGGTAAGTGYFRQSSGGVRMRGTGTPPGVLSLRLAQVAIVAALLAAPELVALARFSDLYTFVLYSGYDGLGEYAMTAARAVTWPVLALGVVGLVLGFIVRQRRATTSAAAALVLYVVLTATLVVVPAAAGLAPQLEPTRLMPLQRLLTVYLAAAGFWMAVSWVVDRIAPLYGLRENASHRGGWPSPPYPPLLPLAPSSRERGERPRIVTVSGGHQPEFVQRRLLAPLAAAGVVVAILLVQTRPLDGSPPDPASPIVPPVSLYAVATSARPEQADLEAAVRAADESAEPGAALLVLGSALSWHQQLWAPLWTGRPLFYDNWLWYWRPDHAGTPGYDFLAGHHYPDPERTLDRDYLDRHGIGAVVVTGPARDAAARSPLLRPLRQGIYDSYTVLEPVTTVTFGDQNAASIEFGIQRITATSEAPGAPVTARINWHPRWEGTADGDREDIERLDDGYLGMAPDAPVSRADFVYAVQPFDWMARGVAVVGVAGLGWLILWQKQGLPLDGRWYPRLLGRDGRFIRERERELEDAGRMGSVQNDQ